MVKIMEPIMGSIMATLNDPNVMATQEVIHDVGGNVKETKELTHDVHDTVKVTRHGA